MLPSQLCAPPSSSSFSAVSAVASPCLSLALVLVLVLLLLLQLLLQVVLMFVVVAEGKERLLEGSLVARPVDG